MINATVTVTGKTMADVVEAFEEGIKRVRQGDTMGHHKDPDKRFTVSISRSGDADEVVVEDGLTDMAPDG